MIDTVFPLNCLYQSPKNSQWRKLSSLKKEKQMVCQFGHKLCKKKKVTNSIINLYLDKKKCTHFGRILEGVELWYHSGRPNHLS